MSDNRYYVNHGWRPPSPDDFDMIGLPFSFRY